MLFVNRFMMTDCLVQKSGPEVGMWVALLLACLGHQRVPMKFSWKSSLDLSFGKTSLNLFHNKG